MRDSEAGPLPGTRAKVCSSHGDSGFLLRDSNEKGSGDHSKRRRENGSECEGKREDGGDDNKRASPAGVAQGEHTKEGDEATCITAPVLVAAVEGGISNVHSAPGIMLLWIRIQCI